MKKLIIIALVLLSAISVLGQSRYVQDKQLAQTGWPTDNWYFFARGETASSSALAFNNLKTTDTTYTANVYVYPYMDFRATVADTNAAHDSLNFKVEMWASDRTTTTTFMFVKTLLWNFQDGTVQNSAVINAAGNWWSNPGNTHFPGFYHFYLRIIPLATHAKTSNGANITSMRGMGHILSK